MNAVLSREEVATLEGAVAAVVALGARPSSGERAAPPKGGDGSRGAAGNVGGYNSFWLDPGSTFTMVNGEARTSIVVDPSDGRLPPLTPAARQRLGALLARPSAENDPGLDPTPGAYDDPERRPLGERCLLGFGSAAGPPALPNYFYNNLRKIVQTPDRIVILNEMVHDVRVIRMNAQHLPPHIRKWAGDSVGRWEGDTLVAHDGGKHWCRGAGSIERSGQRPARDRTLHTRRGEGAALPLHDRGSGNLGTAMDGRVHLAGNRSTYLRVRVSRSELRAGEHSAGRQAA